MPHSVTLQTATQVQTILFLDHATGIGGAELNLFRILEHVDRSRWRPQLASNEGILAQEAAKAAIQFHPIPLVQLRRSPRFILDMVKGIVQLCQLVKQLDAQIIHANTVRAAMYAAPAAILCRRLFVWHMQDFWLSENRPRFLWPDTALKRLLCLAASRIITVSNAVAENLPRGNHIVTVPNGIDLAYFDSNQDGSAFRAKHHIPQDAPLIGTIGRLRPWKGQVRFLHMAAQVVRQNTNAQFVIVGGSPFGVVDNYPKKLRRLTAELNLTHRVTFTGQLDDVRPALAAMDIFVHPGEPEPFGLVNVEAMAMAKPVIAFAHGALPEIVSDGETGLLVPSGDLTQMTQAIVALLQDSSTARRLGQNGRRRAETHFDIRRTVAQIEAIYSEILNHT